MKIFDKLAKLFTQNIGYTFTLVLALICFIYFTKGDLIGGIFTAIFALIIYSCIILLYKEYKKMSAPKPAAVKKTAVKKAPIKKSKKK